MEKFVVIAIVTRTSMGQIELEAETEEAAVAAASAMVADGRMYVVGDADQIALHTPEGVNCLALEQEDAEIAVIENTTAELEEGGSSKG